MATVKLTNTREHDITLSIPSGGAAPIIIHVPGAKQDPDDRQKIIYGQGDADDAEIDAGRKASKVIDYYFSAGWLRLGDDDAEVKRPARAKQ